MNIQILLFKRDSEAENFFYENKNQMKRYFCVEHIFPKRKLMSFVSLDCKSFEFKLKAENQTDVLNTIFRTLGKSAK